MTVIPLRKVEPIGGSEAAAACGVDPHTSRTMLWLYKTGRVERPETEAMEWGKLLQPLVIEVLSGEAYGYDVHEWYSAALEDPERPWLIGHPDGTVADDENGAGLLEVKTVNQWAKRGWDGPPIEYVAQCQTYMHLSGMPYTLLAVLVGGQKLETHIVRRSDETIRKMLALTEEFYGYLVRDEPPPKGKGDREALALLHPEAHEGEVVRLDRAQMATLRTLRARREQRAAVDEQIETLENVLKGVMGDAETAIDAHDNEVLHWRNYERTYTAVKELREAHPEIAAEFVKTTTTRRFQVL